MKKSIKVLVTFLAFICASFLILGVSATDIADENTNTVISKNDLLLFSSSFSGDFTFSADGSSMMLLSDDEFYLSWDVADEKIYSTAGNEVKQVWVCDHDYTPRQAADARKGYMSEHKYNIWEEYEYDGLSTGSYNCHAYAWYGSPENGSYWLNSIDAFIDDVHCQTLNKNNKSELQEGDIIVFFSGDVPIHSAKVYSIRYEAGNSEPIIELISKCGQQGVYIHSFEYTEILYPHDDYAFYRYTQGQHDWEIIENNGGDGVTLGCKATRKIDGVDTYCTHTMECNDLVYYQGTDSSGHYASCENGCFNLFEEHDYVVDTVLNYGHVLRCQWCNYREHVDHEYYIYEIAEEYHCILKCDVCDYDYHCFHELNYSNTESSGHNISCTLGCFQVFDPHSLYMYSADAEDYVVKCRDCNYTVECWESPEYGEYSNDEHWIGCPCGCYSFYEPHTPESYTDIDEPSHEVVCADCGDTYYEDHNYGDGFCTTNSNYHYYKCDDCGYIALTEAHTFAIVNVDVISHHLLACLKCNYSSPKNHVWLRIGPGYRCLECNMYTQDDVRALTDDELRLYLSKLSKDELEALIGNLHEDLIPSITALLPRETDELLTE